MKEGKERKKKDMSERQRKKEKETVTKSYKDWYGSKTIESIRRWQFRITLINIK